MPTHSTYCSQYDVFYFDYSYFCRASASRHHGNAHYPDKSTQFLKSVCCMKHHCQAHWTTHSSSFKFPMSRWQSCCWHVASCSLSETSHCYETPLRSRTLNCKTESVVFWGTNNKSLFNAFPATTILNFRLEWQHENLKISYQHSFEAS